MTRSFRRPAPSFWLAISLVAVVFAIYANVYGNAFLYDDEFLIQKNVLLRDEVRFWSFFGGSSTAGAGGADSFYRPMQGLLYWLVYQSAGLSTAGFHLLNLLLHAGNAVLVFLLGRRLGLRESGAWAGALLWAAHPLHTEAVTYMSATADPLHVLFVLGAVLLFLRGGWGIAAACGSFALALLSKESAIVAPAIAMVCVFLLSEKRWRPRTYLATLPLWMIAFGYLLTRKLLAAETFEFYKKANVYSENLIYRVWTFLATLPSYAEILFWPEGLHMDRAFPVFAAFALPVALGLALLLLGAGVIWWQRKSPFPVAAWAVLWFLAAHLPHTGILLPVNSLFLEHWLYLPSIGFFLAAGHGLSGLLRRWLPVAVVPVALVLGVATFRQNEIWADPVTFYTNILSHNPNAVRVRNNLAMAYSDRGELERAAREYEAAIAQSDEYPQTHHNLGLLRARQGRFEEAIRELEKAVAMDPGFYHSYFYLAEIHGHLGHADLQREYQRKYLETRRRFEAL